MSLAYWPVISLSDTSECLAGLAESTLGFLSIVAMHLSYVACSCQQGIVQTRVEQQVKYLGMLLIYVFSQLQMLWSAVVCVHCCLNLYSKAYLHTSQPTSAQTYCLHLEPIHKTCHNLFSQDHGLQGVGVPERGGGGGDTGVASQSLNTVCDLSTCTLYQDCSSIAWIQYSYIYMMYIPVNFQCSCIYMQIVCTCMAYGGVSASWFFCVLFAKKPAAGWDNPLTVNEVSHVYVSTD